MMRVVSRGHAGFAVVMIALGVQGLITGQLTAVWQPIPKSVPAHQAIAYLCALISLASGVGLLLRLTAALAARALLAFLLSWSLVFRVPVIARAPLALLPWDGCAETAVIVAGAWVLYAWFAADWDRRRLGFATGERGVGIARVLYGLSMIPFGLAHFAYAQHTAELVPGWLPAHLFWAYFFGATFIAAGAGMLLGVLAPLAAALSVLQVGLFTVLVWVPILAAGTKDPYSWLEFATSVAIAAGGWVVADSYRGPSAGSSAPDPQGRRMGRGKSALTSIYLYRNIRPWNPPSPFLPSRTASRCWAFSPVPSGRSARSSAGCGCPSPRCRNTSAC